MGHLRYQQTQYVMLRKKKTLKTDSLDACPFAAGDTNDNKTAVGPEDVSKMGCPCLGEHTKLEVIIEESYEFKVMPVTSELQRRVTLSPAFSSMWLHQSNKIMATFHTDVLWCFILPSEKTTMIKMVGSVKVTGQNQVQAKTRQKHPKIKNLKQRKGTE